MNGKDLYYAMSQVEDKYLDLAETYQPEQKETVNHHFGRRALMGLLAAALCASVLAVTAMSAGWVPGIFKSLPAADEKEEALFEAAAQANSEIFPESKEIPQLDLSRFTLLEKYYDGESILLGYDLEAVIPPPTVGVVPDKELLRTIKRDGYPTGGGLHRVDSATENAKKHHLGRNAFAVDEMMKNKLSPEEYDRAWAILESQGWICLTEYSIGLGDHILVNGHDLFEAYDPQDNAYAGRTEYQTEYGDCLVLNPLPLEGRDQDSVTVTIPVNVGLWYWYMDLDGNGRDYYVPGERANIDFQLERTEKEAAQ